jgi:hypothetical protein
VLHGSHYPGQGCAARTCRCSYLKSRGSRALAIGLLRTQGAVGSAGRHGWNPRRACRRGCPRWRTAPSRDRLSRNPLPMPKWTRSRAFWCTASEVILPGRCPSNGQLPLTCVTGEFTSLTLRSLSRLQAAAGRGRFPEEPSRSPKPLAHSHLPQLLARLYEDRSTLERFQLTSGVLGCGRGVIFALCYRDALASGGNRRELRNHTPPRYGCVQMGLARYSRRLTHVRAAEAQCGPAQVAGSDAGAHADAGDNMPSKVSVLATAPHIPML